MRFDGEMAELSCRASSDPRKRTFRPREQVVRTNPTPDGRTGRRCILLTALMVFTAVTAKAEPLPLPPAMQEKVNRAIDSGAVFLKSTAGPWGTWAADKTHATGYAALPGLTLLECGVPPQNPAVHNAAVFVRLAAPN